MFDFRPDLDLRTPKLLQAVAEMVPTPKGYRCAYKPTAHTAHTYSLAANEVYPNAVFATRWLSQYGGIVIVGTNQKLNVYDYTNGFINVSKGGNYSLGSYSFAYGEDAPGRFDLCAFGDMLIACNKAVATQKRSALDLTSGTLFADLAGAPKGNTCCVAANFVFIGDIATYGAVTGSPDILAWCALGDYTSWVPSPSTQASYAQFNDTPGAITAVRPFRDGILVCKADAIYRGRYVGAGTNSSIWDFERLSDRIGCLGHRSYTLTDIGAVFVGRDDIYLFDDTRPISITAGIRDTLAPYFTQNGSVAMAVGHDKPNKSVWFTADVDTYVWQYGIDRWSKLLDNLTYPVAYCQTNADDFRKLTLASVSSGVPTYTTTSDHRNLYTMFMGVGDGGPYNRNTTRSNVATFTSNIYGEAGKLQTLQRVKPIFSRRPATVANATLTIQTSQFTPSNFSSLSPSVTLNSSYRFDCLAVPGTTAVFFQFVFICTEDFEIIDLIPEFVQAGTV